MTPPSTSAADDHAAPSAENGAVETAMGTGSDEGAPGEDSAGPPLMSGESELLERLRENADGEPIQAVEDSSAMTAAAENDATLPGRDNQTPDGTSDPGVPQFAGLDGA